jgi:hypothetical protein
MSEEEALCSKYNSMPSTAHQSSTAKGYRTTAVRASQGSGASAHATTTTVGLDAALLHNGAGDQPEADTSLCRRATPVFRIQSFSVPDNSGGGGDFRAATLDWKSGGRPRHSWRQQAGCSSPGENSVESGEAQCRSGGRSNSSGGTLPEFRKSSSLTVHVNHIVPLPEQPYGKNNGLF